MTPNTDIFICTHKNVHIPVQNESYKLISCGGKPIDGAIMDNTGDNISKLNGFYCELTGIYWVWKNWDVKDYVGFCHYRRYFEFMDDIPDLSKEDYDVILTNPIGFGQSLYKRYENSFNIIDLDIMLNIAEVKYGVYCDNVLSGKWMNARNMFVMKKEHFYEYCEFLFGVIDEYRKVRNIQSMVDVYNLVLDNPKYRGDFIYQSRIAGFIAEYLLQIWVNHKGLKVKTFNYLHIERKS